MQYLRKWVLAWLLLSVSVVLAQDASCPAIVEAALNAVDEFCQDTGRNQACYGNISLSAEPQADAADFTFEKTGDIVDVSDIESLTLEPMDAANNAWGVVLMQLQADIPDTLPGQNVTFILYGDVAIQNAASNDQNPMQAFYLQTGLGDAPCEEAPESGLLIQTPDGVEEVSFNINGTDVSVGSTVMIQAQPESDMTINTVEGTAVVELDGGLYPAVAGSRIRVPMGEDLRPAGIPAQPEAYDEVHLQGLPLRPLGRPIDVAPPLPPEVVEQIHEQLAQGQPPCGEAPLPPCERFENFQPERGGWTPGENRPPIALPPDGQPLPPGGFPLPPRPEGEQGQRPEGQQPPPAGTPGQRPEGQRPEGTPGQRPEGQGQPPANRTPQPGGNTGGQQPPPPNAVGTPIPPPPDGGGQQPPPPPPDGGQQPPPPNSGGGPPPPPGGGPPPPPPR